jgi:threonyl-tRNA synthetase
VSQIRIQVLDRQFQRNEREVTTGTTAGDLFQEEKDVVVARVNGELRDLAWALSDGDEVEPVPADSPTGRSVIRHSTAHVLAQAVQQAFPEAKLGIGPPVENGFYYDFQVDRAFTPEDLKSIESKMRDIVKQNQRFVRREVTDDQARLELAGEPFKQELIGLKGSRRGRADHLRQRRRQDRRGPLEGPVPRPARARHPEHPGVQADAQRRRVLARQ